MRNFIIFLSLIFILSACGNTETESSNNVPNNDENTEKVIIDENYVGKLEFLREFDQKYFYEIENPEFLKRLETMLGEDEYLNFSEYSGLQIPAELEGDMFWAWGSMPHSGGLPNATFVADIKNDIIYVRLLNEDGEKLFSENNEEIPENVLELLQKEG